MNATTHWARTLAEQQRARGEAEAERVRAEAQTAAERRQTTLAILDARWDAIGEALEAAAAAYREAGGELRVFRNGGDRLDVTRGARFLTFVLVRDGADPHLVITSAGPRGREVSHRSLDEAPALIAQRVLEPWLR